LKKAEHNISENLKGWVTTKEFTEVLPHRVSNHDIREIKDFVNNRDKINIRSTGSTKTKSTYFIDHETDNPYQEYKEDIPSDTHSIFDEWVGMGRSPRVIVALIQYLTSEDKTVIVDVADKNDCCTASIQNNKEDMKEDLRDQGLKVYDK